MEGFIMVLVYIVSLVWAILSIILFFKVWGMTNRVIDIQNLFEKHSKNVDDKLGGVNFNIRKDERNAKNRIKS